MRQGRVGTMKYWLKPAILLSVLFALPIFFIRSLPYNDRASQALIQEGCPAPCFLGIRPGESTMQFAFYTLDAHDWVATRAENFPSQVQQAVFYDAAVPRIHIEWRWTKALPAWVNEAQNGSLTLEDRGVRDITIDTRLLLGEVVLAFGEPDEAWFVTSASSMGRQFLYSAWYAGEGMLITTEGLCPAWHAYTAPVKILFRPDTPKLSEGVSKTSVCR